MNGYARTIGYLCALLCVAIAAAGFFLLKFLPPSMHMAWILRRSE